jgi:hypothetical protein
MAINASEAETDKVYRVTQGATRGSYYTVYKQKRGKLIQRLQKRRNGLNGQQMSLLTTLVRKPDWPVFIWHLRGTDPFTGNKFEIKNTQVLPPTLRLREVKTKPGY